MLAVDSTYDVTSEQNRRGNGHIEVAGNSHFKETKLLVRDQI